MKMKKEKKKTVAIAVSPEFWDDWRVFAEKQGMSASNLLEVMGKTVMKSYDGAFSIFDEIFGLIKKEKESVKRSI
jgi:hypothetical protein